ncbi:nucleotidyltransferase domain-containing protein [Natrialba sp. INN-245]|uniref:type VII toxin-antitoxin system MntA family adenylyltransferase antitoxin n=1 Tax=Natrialba sp. INN-245 TaxID=2690967 RepID=UPI001313BA67|nr:nucleotidyltransferase domain-containing protein [Natrialba sp. INN-245]MWV41021.1 hypothetical protein [Natrialba sp. INN-245]
MDDGVPDETTIETLRSVLAENAVSFALLFGSGARGSMADRSDLDVAIEFDDRRPGDDGYSEAYLRLCATLAEEVPTSIDVVDVHAMSPRFARVAFDEGEVILGSDQRRAELADEYAGQPPSVRDACDRVAAAVERLREGSS